MMHSRLLKSLERTDMEASEGESSPALGILESLADDGTDSGVEAEGGAGDVSEPFDPDSISIDPKTLSMDHLLRRLRQGSIKLAPGFQRQSVWNVQRKSLLMESLMLRIPLPMFYVSADRKGNWDVVDGLQRLTAIRDFLWHIIDDGSCDGGKDSNFKLQKLEFWGDRFDGKSFVEIDTPENAKIVNNIMETEFRFTVVNPGTPEEVKRNIFKRINTGGIPLTQQEIRNALYQGKATRCLNDLSCVEEFKSVVGSSINTTRMVDKELILRYVAFKLFSYKSYYGNMDDFLSNTMRYLNDESLHDGDAVRNVFKDKNIEICMSRSYDDLEASFRQAMIRARDIFGAHAFRKSVPGENRSQINKSLFETWGVVLSNLEDDAFDRLKNNSDKLVRMFKRALTDDKFEMSVSRRATEALFVQYRYDVVLGIVSEVTGGCDDF